MGRKNRRGSRTKEGTDQPNERNFSTTAAPQHTTELSVQKTEGGRNRVSQGLLNPLQQTSSRATSTAAHNDFVEIRSPVNAAPATPPSSRSRLNSGWRKRQSTQTAAEQDSLLPINRPIITNPVAPSHSGPSPSHALRHPDTLADSRSMRHYETLNCGRGRGRSMNSRSSPSYSRVTLPPLPYDTDGASSTEQVKIQSNRKENLRVDSSLSNQAISSSLSSSVIIEQSPEYMARLRTLIASHDMLQKHGYVVKKLSDENLEGKKRCVGCGKSMSKFKRTKTTTRPLEVAREGSDTSRDGVCEQARLPEGEKPENLESLTSSREEGNAAETQAPGQGVSTAPTRPPATQRIIRCKFHDGTVVFKMWSCCGGHVSSPPCTGNVFHSPCHYFTGEIECLWQFHLTLPPSPRSQSHAAVAIDCEMGAAKSGDSELIRVTVIDYFSSSILVDRLVYPNVEMEHYNTRFSGVTRKDMAIARRERKCIMGRDNARREVWRFVGPDTIVVGHSASNDLTALRWIHPVVVDTFLIESAKAKEEDDESKKRNDESKEEEDESKEEEDESKEGKDESKEGKDESKEGNDHSKEKTDGAANEEDETAPTPAIPAHAPDGPRTGQQAQRKRAKGSGKLSLQALAKRRLGREIQTAGKKGHDSLEDATAARDLVHWHVVSGQSVGEPEG